MRSRDFARPAREIIVIAHNIRSILNVGAILRTAEGFGVSRVLATGWTPNLAFATDGSGAKLLPHIRAKLARELHKTALGAEEIVDFAFRENIFDLISELRKNGFLIVGLEQDTRAISLPDFSQKFLGNKGSAKIALLLGEEVSGLANNLRNACDALVEIPMFGRKESFNVSVAAGIALYELSVARC